MRVSQQRGVSAYQRGFIGGVLTTLLVGGGLALIHEVGVLGAARRVLDALSVPVLSALDVLFVVLIVWTVGYALVSTRLLSGGSRR